MRARALPDGQVGHILIRGAERHPRLLRRSGGDGAGHRRGRLGRHRRSRRHARGRAVHRRPQQGNHLRQRSELLSLRSGEHRAARARASISTRWSPRASPSPAPRARSWWCSCCIAAACEEFLPTAAAVSRLINEHTGLEVAQVIPTKRIPKTTSGKVQRHLLEQAYIDGEFDAELAELEALREAHGGLATCRGSELEARLQAICEAALPGKRIDVNDNLFEIGASSLKLIEIHENIDREFPGPHRSDRAVRSSDHRASWRSIWKANEQARA